MIKQFNEKYIPQNIGIKSTANASHGTFESVNVSGDITNSNIAVNVSGNNYNFFNFTPEKLTTKNGAILIKFSYITNTFYLNAQFDLYIQDTLINTLYINTFNENGFWQENKCLIFTNNTDYANSYTKIMTLGDFNSTDDTNNIEDFCIKIGDNSDFISDDITIHIKNLNIHIVGENDDTTSDIDFNISLITNDDNYRFENWTKTFGLHKIVDGNIICTDDLISYKNSKYESLEVKGNSSLSLATKYDVENLNEFNVIGPDSSVDENICAFDGNSGDLIKDSGVNLIEYIDVVNVLTKDNNTTFTPDNDYEPATKKYAIDNLPVVSGDLFFESDIYHVVQANSTVIVDSVDAINNTAYIWEYFISNRKSKFELNTLNVLVKNIDTFGDVIPLYTLPTGFIAEHISISKDGSLIGFGKVGSYRNSGDIAYYSHAKIYQDGILVDNGGSIQGRTAVSDVAKMITTGVLYGDYARGLHIIQTCDLSNDGLDLVGMQYKSADETVTTGRYYRYTRADITSGWTQVDSYTESTVEDKVINCAIAGDGKNMCYTTSYPGIVGSPAYDVPEGLPPLPSGSHGYFPFSSLLLMIQLQIPWHAGKYYFYNDKISQGWVSMIPAHTVPAVAAIPARNYLYIKDENHNIITTVSTPPHSRDDTLIVSEDGTKIFKAYANNDTCVVYNSSGGVMKTFTGSNRGSMSNDGKIFIIWNNDTLMYDIMDQTYNIYANISDVGEQQVAISDYGIIAFANGVVKNIPRTYTTNEDGIKSISTEIKAGLNSIKTKVEFKIKNNESTNIYFKAKRIIQ